MDIVKKRSTIPCFWEGQAGGCKKPHCPFLHDAPKDPYPEDMSELMGGVPPSGHKIIVNKNKMDQLGGLIWPVKPNAGSFLAGRVSVKDRLGGNNAQSSGIKARLGGIEPGEELQLFEVDEEEDDEAVNSEEETLRRGAIQTLDLRSRLAGGTISRIVRHVPVSSDEEDKEPDPFVGKKVKSVIKKVKKEEKVKKRLLKKKAKKLKKEEKRQKKRAVRRSRESEQDMISGEEEENLSDNEKDPHQKPSGTKRKMKENEDIDPTGSSEDKDKTTSPRKRSKREDKPIYDPLAQRRLKAKKKKPDPSSLSSATSKVKHRSKSESIEDEKLDAVANESIDVIKEIDELLNNSD